MVRMGTGYRVCGTLSLTALGSGWLDATGSGIAFTRTVTFGFFTTVLAWAG